MKKLKAKIGILYRLYVLREIKSDIIESIDKGEYRGMCEFYNSLLFTRNYTLFSVIPEILDFKPGERIHGYWFSLSDIGMNKRLVIIQCLINIYETKYKQLI